jgi:hypothetical protein
MKARIYLRLARGGRKGFKVSASENPDFEPLKTGGRYLPTVCFALDVDLEDREFSAARNLLEIQIRHAEPAVEVREVEEE